MRNSGSAGVEAPSGSGVLALDVGAERPLFDGAGTAERRSAILDFAAKLVFSRIAASWDGEKDHSWYCDDWRYRASSVAMAGNSEMVLDGRSSVGIEVRSELGNGMIGLVIPSPSVSINWQHYDRLSSFLAARCVELVAKLTCKWMKELEFGLHSDRD